MVVYVGICLSLSYDMYTISFFSGFCDLEMAWTRRCGNAEVKGIRNISTITCMMHTNSLSFFLEMILQYLIYLQIFIIINRLLLVNCYNKYVVYYVSNGCYLEYVVCVLYGIKIYCIILFYSVLFCFLFLGTGKEV